MKNKLKNFILISIILSIFALYRGFFEQQGRKNEGNMALLISLSPQQVNTLRVYPKVGQPVGVFREFRAPDQLVGEFFLSITDVHTYLPDHDTVWEEQQWLLEVYAKEVGKVIPVSFYIPYQRGNIVVADMLGNDGYFQSQQLFHWYQKHSHRWLEPEESQ